MNKTVATLSLTTAIFAASTLYLAYKLYGGSHGDPLAASNAAVAGEPRSSAVDTQVDATTNRVAAPGTLAAQSPTGPRAGNTPVDAQRASMLPYARQYLARLDDPAQRATVLEETRSNLRRQYEPLRQKLKLDSATFEQLLTVLAEQQIQPQEKYFRCLADPDCDLANFGRSGNVVDDRSGELLSLLGSDAFNELRDYTNSLGDRETVTQLRGRLNDSNTLRDSQADQLVAALTEERTRYQKEVTQRGATVSGWGTPQLGMLYFSGDSSSIEQRLSEAAQYSRRLRERAATVLSPQQLAAFAQLQDELLATMRASMLPPG